MKIYLAGPMRGVPDFNFPKFYKYAHALRSLGHEVFNPAEIGLHQDNIRTIFAVEMDWLCREAEAIYLIPGWQESRGARAERALAEALDLKVVGVHFRPTPPPGNLYPSALPSLTTSPSPSPKSPKSPSPDKNNMEPRGGISQSLRTMPMLWSVIFWSAGLLTAIVCVTLLKWLGVV